MQIKSFKRGVLALAIGFACHGQLANAAGTDGAIKGEIIGEDNASTITVTDESRGFTRSIDVDGDSEFTIRSLPPGTYTVKLMSGETVIDSTEVAIGLGSTVGLQMGGRELMEEVTVTGERVAAVDMGLAETGLVINSESLIGLPVARDVTEVTMLAPGVSRGDVDFGTVADSSFTSIGGSSIAENVFYLNGLNITNFRNGLGFSEIPFEFIDSIQVKTGGYSAKFGRSTGGVVNAITKRGSNDFSFGANLYYNTYLRQQPDTITAVNEKDEFEDTSFDLWAGGAIIPDRLFYYAIFNRNKEEQEYYGARSGRGFKYEEDTDFWGIKLDGYISENHRLEFTAFSDEKEGVEGSYEYDADTDTVGDYLGDTLFGRGGTNWVLSYTGALTDSLELSVSYGENQQDRTNSPGTSNIPVVYEYNSGFIARGEWTEFLVEEGEDTREMTRIDLTWDLGNHVIETGLDREVNTSTQTAFNSGGVYWLLDPTNEYNGCDTATECPQGANARRRTYAVGGEFEVETSAFYIQDTWEITDDLSVELGLRNESFKNLNGGGESFIEITDQWAPRISAAWDPTGDGNQKVFGSFGHYYLPIASNTNIRMAGNETYIHDFYDWDGNCTNADFTPCNLGSIYDTDVLGDGSVPDTRSLVDKNIEPMFQEELILGYQIGLDSDWLLGVKSIYRNLSTSIEDVAIDAAVIDYYNTEGDWTYADGTVEEVFSGFHQYVLTNPGNDMTIYIPETDEFIDLSAEQLQYPEATRQYLAFELTAAMPFNGKWSFDGSYTWGHSWGNSEGYVKSDNGQDDAGLTTSFDQPGLTDGSSGNLPNDRRHTIKAFGNYRFESDLTVGAFFMWQSGRPKNCIGVHPTDDFAAVYGAESFYCQGEANTRGSFGRTENFWTVDANIQYPVKFGGNQELLLGLDIFNLFNTQTVTEVYETGDTDGGEIDPDFGEIRSYQRPQELRLTVRYKFD